MAGSSFSNRKLNALRPGAKRDTQRARVYKAEQVLHLPHTGKTGRTKAPDPALASIEQCQAYVDALTREEWYQRNFPHAPTRIVVANGAGMRAARAVGRSRIELPLWSRQAPVILHEVAHCVTTATFAGAAWHGWEFAFVYLQLVQHKLGRVAAMKLRDSFVAHKVRYSGPRKTRVLTEEEKQVLRDRLAKARAAKQGTIDRNTLALHVATLPNDAHARALSIANTI